MRGFNKGESHSHVCVSGLKNLNPRSESRSPSCSDSHGLEANPPTRKANCMRSFRRAGRGISNSRTEFMERISVKFSLTESTVDWIEGSKNPATCFLCVDGWAFVYREGE